VAFYGRDLGELCLYGSPHAMRQLAQAILLAVDEAERLPIPSGSGRNVVKLPAD
jgi:hypothetical protein